MAVAFDAEGILQSLTSEHLLFFAFCAVAFSLATALGASPLLSLAAVSLTLIPGYLLSLALCELTDVERTVLSLPLGIAFAGVLTLLPNVLLDIKSVGWPPSQLGQ